MSQPQRIYLAGPMTGLPDHNFPAFRAAAEGLQQAGWEVVNPADNFGGRMDLPRGSYLCPRPLPGAPFAVWVSITNEPVYAPEHLVEQRVFTSVLTLTYRAMK